MQHFRTGCRKHTMIRAERLEGLVWGEVKKVLESPGLIVAGIESLDTQEDGGLEKPDCRGGARASEGCSSKKTG